MKQIVPINQGGLEICGNCVFWDVLKGCGDLGLCPAKRARGYKGTTTNRNQLCNEETKDQ